MIREDGTRVLLKDEDSERRVQGRVANLFKTKISTIEADGSTGRSKNWYRTPQLLAQGRSESDEVGHFERARLGNFKDGKNCKKG